MTATRTIRRGALLLSAATIVLVGLVYGVRPDWFATVVLGTAEPPTSVAHLLRALMTLYLAFAAYWVYAAFDARHRSTALLTVVLFPAGLVAGRILSVVVDGQPSSL